MSFRPNRGRAALAGVLAVAALAAGCSGLSARGPNTKSAAGAPVTLTVQTWPGVATEIVANLDAEFVAKHPNVKINLKEFDPNNPPSAPDGVDVIFTADNDLRNLVDGKLVRDLTSLNLPAADNLVAGIFGETGRVSGRRYGVPVAFNPSLILINKKAVQAAGIKTPTADWDWQDLLQALTAARAAGIQSQVNLGAIAESVVRSYGGQIYDADRQQFTFDTPEAKQALGVLQSFVTNGLVSIEGSSGIRVAAAPAGAPQGGAAALGPAFIALNGNIYRGPGDLQSLPYPRGPKGRPARVMGTVAAVSAGSPHEAMATEYVKDLLANPAEQLAMANGGIRPVTADAKALAAWRQAVGDADANTSEAALQDAYIFSQPIPRQADLLNGLMPYLQGHVPLEPTISALVSALNK